MANSARAVRRTRRGRSQSRTLGRGETIVSSLWRAVSRWHFLPALVAASLLCLMVLPITAGAKAGWKVRDSAGSVTATVRITDAKKGWGIVSHHGTVYASAERRRAGLWFMGGPTGYYHAFVKRYGSAPRWRIYGDDRAVFGRVVRRQNRQLVEELVDGHWSLWGTTVGSCPAWLAATGVWATCSQPGQ